MFPVIFSLGPVAISSLGVFSFLAFVLGTFLFWRRGKEESYDEEKLLDVTFLSLIVGWLTGRVGFILEHWPEFNSRFQNFLDFEHHGGGSFVGALVGVVVVFWLFSWRQRWNFWALVDTAIFGLVWAQIFLRLGQFLDGSYFGRETSLFLGMTFPGLGGRRFPIQLFEVGFLLVLFFWLRRLEKHYRLFVWYQDGRGETRPGFLFSVYLLTYSLFRLLLALFQESSLYLEGLALPFWVSLLGLTLSVGIFFERMGRWERWGRRFSHWRETKKKTSLPVILATKNLTKRHLVLTKRSHIKTGRDAKF